MSDHAVASQTSRVTQARDCVNAAREPVATTAAMIAFAESKSRDGRAISGTSSTTAS